MTTPIQEIKPLDGATALELLRLAAKEKGEEYVYVNQYGHKAGTVINQDGMTADCAYVHERPDGTLVPGCIAADVLHRHGVPLWALRAYESQGVHLFIEEAGWGNYDAGHVLGVAQAAQDMGQPWGFVVAHAETIWEEMLKRYEEAE